MAEGPNVQEDVGETMHASFPSRLCVSRYPAPHRQL